MRAMIESLLEYSRVSTRGDPIEETDAGEVLDDVLDDLQLRIEETNADVTVDDLPTVNADPNQLGQLFRNLVSNATKYSGDESPKVHVSADRVGDAWQFPVADEGIGIPPDFHDRIFDLFERLGSDGGTDESGAGSGSHSASES